jgi:hypothetical protein
LAAAARERDWTQRWAGLQKSLDTDRFLSFLAMEIILWHQDGYGLSRDNYLIYHDPATDKMVFLPGNIEDVLGEPAGPLLPPLEGLVAKAVLELPEGRRSYRQRLATLATNVFKVPSLTNRIHQAQLKIRPLLAAINREMAEDHDVAIEGLIEQLTERAEALAQLLKVPPPRPLKFDANGGALLSSWRADLDPGNMTLDQAADPDGRAALRIQAGRFGKRTSAWRTDALLDKGRYRFEGRVRTSGVIPPPRRRREGAGLKLGGAKEGFTSKVAGTAPWTPLAIEFVINGAAEEVEFICELTAAAGEAWFDLDSLRLTKLGQ